MAIFSLSGYIPVVSERLKIFTNEGARMGRDSLINLRENSSWPVELLFFKFRTVLIISVMLVLNRKMEEKQDLLEFFLYS